jgi:hypothetical protein
VSVFRPARRVTAPDGREWEIYAFRIELPQRRSHGLRSLARVLLREWPRAALRALRSDGWTIEARTWDPYHARYRWRTTRELRGQVLAQVEGQLARGETPSPRNATYLGGAA